MFRYYQVTAMSFLPRLRGLQGFIVSGARKILQHVVRTRRLSIYADELRKGEFTTVWEPVLGYIDP